MCRQISHHSSLSRLGTTHSNIFMIILKLDVKNHLLDPTGTWTIAMSQKSVKSLQ